MTIEQTLRNAKRVRLYIEPRDLWVGLYWCRSADAGHLVFYICLLPMLVLRLNFGPRLWFHELAHLLRLNLCRNHYGKRGYECVTCGKFYPWGPQ